SSTRDDRIRSGSVPRLTGCAVLMVLPTEERERGVRSLAFAAPRPGPVRRLYKIANRMTIRPPRPPPPRPSRRSDTGTQGRSDHPALWPCVPASGGVDAAGTAVVESGRAVQNGERSGVGEPGERPRLAIIGGGGAMGRLLARSLRDAVRELYLVDFFGTGPR